MKIVFEHYYSCFHYCLLSCPYVMLQKSISSKQNRGAQAVVRGGTAPLASRNNGTGSKLSQNILVFKISIDNNEKEALS